MPEDVPKWKPPKAVQKSHQKTMGEIGEKLEKLREGMSASKLSDDLKISRNSYRQMEKGVIVAVENRDGPGLCHGGSPISIRQDVSEECGTPLSVCHPGKCRMLAPFLPSSEEPHVGHSIGG